MAFIYHFIISCMTKCLFQNLCECFPNIVEVKALHLLPQVKEIEGKKSVSRVTGLFFLALVVLDEVINWVIYSGTERKRELSRAFGRGNNVWCPQLLSQCLHFSYLPTGLFLLFLSFSKFPLLIYVYQFMHLLRYMYIFINYNTLIIPNLIQELVSKCVW